MGLFVNKFMESVQVVQNEHLASSIYKLVLQAPKTASVILPGQFVHMQVASAKTAMLRRPFSVYQASESEGTITIIYDVVGSGTELMSKWHAGQNTTILAPLGNTWAEGTQPKRALLVGAGVGAAPLFMLAKKLKSAGTTVDTALGARTKDLLVTKNDYEALGLHSVEVATDDGTAGFNGFCTKLAEEMLASNAYDYVATCGPVPVMKEIANLCAKANVNCEVSMEERMACGVGTCKTCVVNTTDGKQRTCSAGPVFNARSIKW